MHRWVGQPGKEGGLLSKTACRPAVDCTPRFGLALSILGDTLSQKCSGGRKKGPGNGISRGLYREGGRGVGRARSDVGGSIWKTMQVIHVKEGVQDEAATAGPPSGQRLRRRATAPGSGGTAGMVGDGGCMCAKSLHAQDPTPYQFGAWARLRQWRGGGGFQIVPPATVPMPDATGVACRKREQ